MSTMLRRTWLPFLNEDVPETCDTPAKVAAHELKLGCAALGIGSPKLAVEPSMGEGYAIKDDTITGGSVGILYGVYAFLSAKAAGEPVPEGTQSPFWRLRMLNSWDNADGSVERGYSGRSLWFEGGELRWDGPRIRQLGRMLASAGINVLCVNNVNVRSDAARLIEDKLPDLARLADAFRPFGVRLMVSIEFSRPLAHGVGTADPLDAKVQAWWAERANAVWAAIPDLAGFLVKADSEHRPGPFTYGRTHAEGANMLARAIAPHGGTLVWRAFVYNCQQDWRDTATDRPKAACETYAPLDGQFDDNVLLQVKNGPFDFQVREPVSPTFYAMPNTNLALEVQLAQEYTGQQIDLYAMNPMWREIAEDLPPRTVSAIAAVSNLGRDDNYTGHPFAAANLYGFGRFAWNPFVDPEAVLRTWARLTYRLPAAQEDALVALLINSRGVYEKYTANLGLDWMVNPHNHYGPNPLGYEFDLWGTYNRADRNAVGVDRTAAGTGYTLQYPEAMRARYEKAEDCPDNLKLFFHRLPYDYAMADGRTLIQRLYDDHFEGCAESEAMAETLASLDLPEPDKTEARERMAKQIKNAREWRDVLNTFFHRLSGAEDAHGRKIYD